MEVKEIAKINRKIKELPLFLRARQAEEILGISKWHLYRRALTGELKSIKIGGSRLFQTQDILRLLQIKT